MTRAKIIIEFLLLVGVRELAQFAIYIKKWRRPTVSHVVKNWFPMGYWSKAVWNVIFFEVLFTWAGMLAHYKTRLCCWLQRGWHISPPDRFVMEIHLAGRLVVIKRRDFSLPVTLRSKVNLLQLWCLKNGSCIHFIR